MTSCFKRHHLANTEEEARDASVARSGQWGRGLTNTVIEGDDKLVVDKVKAADYSSDTYEIRDPQWGINIDVPYWQVSMRAGTGGYVVSGIEEGTGTVAVKAYFNPPNGVTVTGVHGQDLLINPR